MNTTQTLVRNSIVLLLPLSCFVAFWLYILVGTGCTGTSSAAFAQMAICRFPILYLLGVGVWLLSAGGLWFNLNEARAQRTLFLRVLLFVSFFVVPYLLIEIMSRWRVEFGLIG